MNQKDIDDAIEWERKKNEGIMQNRKRYIELSKLLREKYSVEFPDLPPYQPSPSIQKPNLEAMESLENELLLELIQSVKKTARLEQKQ